MKEGAPPQPFLQALCPLWLKGLGAPPQPFISACPPWAQGLRSAAAAASASITPALAQGPRRAVAAICLVIRRAHGFHHAAYAFYPSKVQMIVRVGLYSLLLQMRLGHGKCDVVIPAVLFYKRLFSLI